MGRSDPPRWTAASSPTDHRYLAQDRGSLPVLRQAVRIGHEARPGHHDTRQGRGRHSPGHGP